MTSHNPKNRNRMLFLQNMDALKILDEEQKNKMTIEYEVTTDSTIVGEFEYGPYYFTIWEFLPVRHEGQHRKLCLRITEKTYDIGDFHFNGEDWLYHGGGVAEELISLSSLFLRRRLILGPKVRWDDKPRLFKDLPGWIDKPVVKGESNLSEIPSLLHLVGNLDISYHQRFILATRLYHQALLLIENQPDLAYLNLISAVETMSNDYQIDGVQLSEINEKLDNLINKVEDERLQKQLKQTILKKEKFIRRRFMKFTLDNTTDDFWKDETRPKIGKIEKDDLPKLLKKIYDQRSDTLHGGKPFPSYIFHSPLKEGEIPFAKSIPVGSRKWDEDEYIPYPHFFERLVNHVLIIFLKRNQLK